ncbi:MAG: beta-ketoacyl-ACP synthase III [Peptostreptococcales bacterium]
MAKRASILGTGSALPEKIITNFDMEKMMDTSDEWIRMRTGIERRRRLEDGKGASDLATEAGRKALLDANVQIEDIDLILVSTLTSDMRLPAAACMVQEKLGVKEIPAFDINAACTGFIYALTIAQSFVETGQFKKILVIGVEILSRIINYKDRNTAVLFGDGAGATVVGESDKEGGILASALKADGEGGKLLYTPAGGSLLPLTHEGLDQDLDKVVMDGSEVFKYAARKMVEVSIEALEKCGLTVEDIDYVVPHQANIRIIQNAVKRMNISMDKVYINIHEYGNMSSASIPVALDEASRAGFLKEGAIILIVGFGAGLTWGASVIKWNK